MGRIRKTNIKRRFLNEAEFKKYFLSRFKRQENGCWLWIGATCNDGYGLLNVNNRTRGIHRISFEMHIGEIPKGLNVNHTCDVRNCGNPEHLWIGTQKQNCTDKTLKGRSRRKLTREQIIEIRERKESSVKLSLIYGVDPSLIQKIRRGERWPILPCQNEAKDLGTSLVS